MLAIVNAAAEAYRGVIPADRWREPFMGAEELDREIAAGVVLWGADSGGRLAGVMGVRAVRDVDLIRHAYVRPEHQGEGSRCSSARGRRRNGRSGSTSATASGASRPRRRTVC